MKKKHIIGIFAFLLLAVAFFFINREGRIVSIFTISRYGYIENVLVDDIEKKIGLNDYRHFGTTISNNVYSSWFAAVTDSGQTVNVFAEFTITLISRSLDKLAIETSNDQKSESGRENLMQGSGDYQVIVGDGYEWTKNVVGGP